MAKLLLTDIKGLQLREVLCSGGYGWGKTLGESVTSPLEFQPVKGYQTQFRKSVLLNNLFQRIGSKMIQTFYHVITPIRGRFARVSCLRFIINCIRKQ